MPDESCDLNTWINNISFNGLNFTFRLVELLNSWYYNNSEYIFELEYTYKLDGVLPCKLTLPYWTAVNTTTYWIILLSFI